MNLSARTELMTQNNTTINSSPINVPNRTAGPRSGGAGVAKTRSIKFDDEVGVSVFNSGFKTDSRESFQAGAPAIDPETEAAIAKEARKIARRSLSDKEELRAFEKQSMLEFSQAGTGPEDYDLNSPFDNSHIEGDHSFESENTNEDIALTGGVSAITSGPSLTTLSPNDEDISKLGTSTQANMNFAKLLLIQDTIGPEDFAVMNVEEDSDADMNINADNNDMNVNSSTGPNI